MRRARARPRKSKKLWQALLIFFALLSCITLYYVQRSQVITISTAENLAKGGQSLATQDDLVIALPTDKSHLPLVQASRSWRKGIRTVVAVNDTRLAEAFSQEDSVWRERWAFYPDDVPLRANYPGDTRAAVVPFLAHKLLGDSYKWILYGDDDTQWFVKGVLSLIRNLDHNMPYFITDNLWWSSINGTIGYQPNLEAPRCLPCGYSKFGRPPGGVLQFPAPEGCPCTPKLLCKADERQVFDEECNIPLHLVPAFSTRTYSMHGGAGGLMSIGLMRAVELSQMEKCIAEHGHSTGGDAFITICLWKLGYAHTDPGPWFNDPAMRLFDAAAGMSSTALAARLAEAAQGSCNDPICNELIDNMVSSHIHSRKAGSIQQAADTVLLLSKAYQGYMDSRELDSSERH